MVHIFGKEIGKRNQIASTYQLRTKKKMLDGMQHYGIKENRNNAKANNWMDYHSRDNLLLCVITSDQLRTKKECQMVELMYGL